VPVVAVLVVMKGQELGHGEDGGCWSGYGASLLPSPRVLSDNAAQEMRSPVLGHYYSERRNLWTLAG